MIRRIGVAVTFLFSGLLTGGLAFMVGANLPDAVFPDEAAGWTGWTGALVGGVVFVMLPTLITAIIMACTSRRRSGLRAWLGWSVLTGLVASVLQAAAAIVLVLVLAAQENVASGLDGARTILELLVTVGAGALAATGGALATNGFRPTMPKPSADIFD